VGEVAPEVGGVAQFGRAIVPANLSSAGQKPPAWLSATPWVVGDLQVAVQRL